MKAKQVPSAEFGELKPLQGFGFLPPAKVFEEPFPFFFTMQCSFCAAVWSWFFGRR
jgi:hypothetical protein